MAFPDISIARGLTLDPIVSIVYSDLARTVREDLAGSIPVALVKDVKGNIIVDLQPQVVLASTLYPDVNDGAGGPLSGYVITFSLTDTQTSTLRLGSYLWDLVNEYSTGEKQLLLNGKFTVTKSITLT